MGSSVPWVVMTRAICDTMSCINIQRMLNRERKEKRRVLTGDSPDHPHAYTNFYFKMECKVPEEDPYSHTELVALPPLTSKSVESLPSIDPASAVECWLANLHQVEGHDNRNDQYDTPSEQYDTPYTTPPSQNLARTMMPNIFIRTTHSTPEPVYENIPNKALSKDKSQTTNNKVHTNSHHCMKSPCLADMHYACT